MLRCQLSKLDSRLRGGLILGALLACAAAMAAEAPEGTPPGMEEPKIIDPGPPPSDAIVLFDGKNLDEWRDKDGPCDWTILEDGSMEGNKESGSIQTAKSFGDCQLHLEWAAPATPAGTGQQRGNSGVYFQGNYEVQILDSYENATYYHGQAGAIYKQYAPLVNACRKPGEWQTFDIIYHRPRFGADGSVQTPAYITVLHNGVLIQDHAEVLGTTHHKNAPEYKQHPDSGPISLQWHNNPVRFRNIWIRPLEPVE
ncbi:MAG: hypothetical protein BWZ10_02402 [candidate division BRC1 bacterium ADurb.BinA364]|nr:MAG: hypothetical protein BWZ10_02402 [candidate division BRC1 bacterium ADurb.BinA364]